MDSTTTSSSQSDTFELPTGTLVAQRYRIESVLARGGMSTVYRATQLPLSRLIALKIVHAETDAPGHTPGSWNATFRERFLLEASILSSVQHPNVVTLHDYGDFSLHDGREIVFMAMEYLPGETLHRRLRVRGRLSVSETLDWLGQVASGLHVAHRLGIVHRDLKPANIVLTPEPGGAERAKLIDFGIVKVLAGGQDLTREGFILGSPQYMAPEQIVGHAIDARADVYAFGVLLFRCLAGEPPFVAAGSIKTLLAQLRETAPLLRTSYPHLDVPTWLEELVASCLAKNPADRPRGMDVVREAMRTASFNASQTAMALARDVVQNEAAVPPPVARRPATRPRKSPWLLAAVAATGAATGIVLAAAQQNNWARRLSAVATGGATPVSATVPGQQADAGRGIADAGEDVQGASLAR